MNAQGHFIIPFSAVPSQRLSVFLRTSLYPHNAPRCHIEFCFLLRDIFFPPFFLAATFLGRTAKEGNTRNAFLSPQMSVHWATGQGRENNNKSCSEAETARCRSAWKMFWHVYSKYKWKRYFENRCQRPSTMLSHTAMVYVGGIWTSAGNYRSVYFFFYQEHPLKSTYAILKKMCMSNCDLKFLSIRRFVK